MTASSQLGSKFSVVFLSVFVGVFVFVREGILSAYSLFYTMEHGSRVALLCLPSNGPCVINGSLACSIALLQLYTCAEGKARGVLVGARD